MNHSVGRLECRQVSEPSEYSTRQKQKRTQNGEKACHDLSDLWIAMPSRFRRHRSLQTFTSSHTFFHFFRHLKGRPQTPQFFSGMLGFL
nr:hypothetical protein [Novipirellula galeiformis]